MSLRPVLTLGARLWWGLAPLVVLAWALGLLVASGLPGLPQAPALVEWLLPVSRYARDVASMLTLGLVVVGLLLSRWRPARTWALAWSGAWLGLLVLQYLLTLADVRAQGLAAAGGDAIASLTADALGWAFLGQAVALLMAVVALALWRSPAGSWAAAVLLALACAAPAAISHAGHSHTAASVSIALHIVAVSLWVGGLAAVLALSAATRDLAVLPRYSRMALWCVVIVAETGLLNASLLVPTPWSFLGSPYGALILAKAVLLGLLVRWGWRQRQGRARLLGPSPGGRARLARFAAAETVVMGTAIAASIVLARLGPPSLAPRSLDPLAAAALALGAPLLLARLPWRPRVVTHLSRLPEVAALVLLAAVALSFLITASLAPADSGAGLLTPAAALVPLALTLLMLGAGWLWCLCTRGWPATAIAVIGWLAVLAFAQSRTVAPDWRWAALAGAVGAACILTTAPRRLPVMAR